MIEFKTVRSHDRIADVARLAREIWIDHYTPIIGPEQVEYMLNHFQSERALVDQIARGYEYYLVEREGQISGYLAVVSDKQDASLMLSKIYVRKSERGRKIGRRMMEFVENLCNRRALKMIWLTVNRNNTESIAWYMRMGFVNAGEVVQDIGGGFVMDDYRMEKHLGE